MRCRRESTIDKLLERGIFTRQALIGLEESELMAMGFRLVEVLGIQGYVVMREEEVE